MEMISFSPEDEKILDAASSELLAKANEYTKKFFDHMQEKHEEMLKNILRQVLKREPLIADMPRVTLISFRTDDQVICLDNVRLGTIRYKYADRAYLGRFLVVGIEFIPDADFVIP